MELVASASSARGAPPRPPVRLRSARKAWSNRYPLVMPCYSLTPFARFADAQHMAWWARGRNKKRAWMVGRVALAASHVQRANPLEARTRTSCGPFPLSRSWLATCSPGGCRLMAAISLLNWVVAAMSDTRLVVRPILHSGSTTARRADGNATRLCKSRCLARGGTRGSSFYAWLENICILPDVTILRIACHRVSAHHRCSPTPW